MTLLYNNQKKALICVKPKLTETVGHHFIYTKVDSLNSYNYVILQAKYSHFVVIIVIFNKMCEYNTIVALTRLSVSNLKSFKIYIFIDSGETKM